MPATDSSGRDSPAYAAELENRKHCHLLQRFVLSAFQRIVARCVLREARL